MRMGIGEGGKARDVRTQDCAPRSYRRSQACLVAPVPPLLVDGELEVWRAARAERPHRHAQTPLGEAEDVPTIGGHSAMTSPSVAASMAVAPLEHAEDIAPGTHAAETVRRY